ncbi:MAG: aminodeoxychorismate synthase component I [Chloroflexi bacterium]|nr:aminodeoxychorismate synthase component I [Chloroflexota bacterium]
MASHSEPLHPLPLIEELPFPLSPLQAFEAFKDRDHSFFLDSGMDPEKLGRYSFVGSDPFLVLKTRGKRILVTRGDESHVLEGNPFDTAGALLSRYSQGRPAAPAPFPVPFLGGAVGYFSYDLCHFIEKLPSCTVDDLQLPECYLGFYDAILAFDLFSGRSYVVSTGFPEEAGRGRTGRARERAAELKVLAHQAARCQPVNLPTTASPAGITLKSNFSKPGYLEAVEKAREYIISGDIFQVNISQRFEADLAAPPYELYRRLRSVNPAPFACYLNFEDVKIAGASPERFLRLTGDHIQTRPIKGTRPRGQTPEEDAALARELLTSIKDRAENIMIVDLERNDLGRVCRFGTVRVTERVILETYPTVFHLTSTVEGRLRPGKSFVELLKASFPGGSITGAPKVRSMEIIDELEPTKRSVYTGSVGYIGFNGDMDLNITIRTFLVKGKKAFFQVGGGIVYDSEPEAEYDETLDKARALIRALRLSPRVEVSIT